MRVTLKRAQRDAIRTQIVSDLREIGEISNALEAGDIRTALMLRDRHGGQMLLLDALGWASDPGDEFGDEFVLTLEPAVLIATLRYLNAITAEVIRCSLGPDSADIKAAADACEATGEALAQVAAGHLYRGSW